MHNQTAEQERQPIIERVALSILNFFGWTNIYNIPSQKSYVLIVAKHTSLWDYPLALLSILASGEKYHWLSHPAFFYGPLKHITTKLGGIPLYDSHRPGIATKLSEQMCNNKDMKLILTPEGTTAFMPRWKTGFYYIAKAAKVPIALGYIDYQTKKLGVDFYIHPSNDIKKDINDIANYYNPLTAKNPDKAGPVIF